MRSPTSIAALTLAFLQGTAAMNNAFARKFNLMADMGLNPDGTPIDSPSADDEFMNIASTQSLKATTADTVSTLAAPEVITPEYVELPIDNFAASKNQAYSYHGTFWNRYWVSTSAYKPGSPVFIYDVGEANAEPNALFRIQNETSFFKQLVDQYHGIGIVWEHRFYGNSSPTPVDINTPAEDFRYLTTEQSLADVDRFAKQFSRKNINYTLTPDKTPWVFVGGSYPAMRAAFMRDKYPDTIYASYASSAPVQASVDQSFYFEPIWRGLNKYGFGNCSRDIQAAVRYMDRIMDFNATAAAQLKIQFLGLGAEKNSHATFADALTTIFATWQSYGVEGGTVGLRRFCDWIETDTDGMKPTIAGADGLSKGKGAKYTVARWADYPWFNSNVNQYLETECSGKENVLGNCDLNRKFTDPAMISWTWQYCTQWGKSIHCPPCSHFLPTPSPTLLAGKHTSSIKSTCTDMHARILPIRQPGPQPTRLKIQLALPPEGNLRPPVPLRPTRPVPRMAQRRPHQPRLRRLGHPAVKHVLVQRRVRPLAHAFARERGAVCTKGSQVVHGPAAVWRGAEQTRVVWLCAGECAALL
jgi:hypothetical protein